MAVLPALTAVLPALTAVLLFCAAGSNMKSAAAGEGSPVAPTMELTVFSQACPFFWSFLDYRIDHPDFFSD